MSHFGHQSQVRAKKWDVDKGVNWEALKTVSNRIQYHIRRRLAAGKVPGCPVLAQALELAQAGYALKLATQTPWQSLNCSLQTSRLNRLLASKHVALNNLMHQRPQAVFLVTDRLHDRLDLRLIARCPLRTFYTAVERPSSRITNCSGLCG